MKKKGNDSLNMKDKKGNKNSVVDISICKGFYEDKSLLFNFLKCAKCVRRRKDIYPTF